MLDVCPYPQSAIEDGSVRAAGLVSIRSPGDGVAIDPRHFEGRVLMLAFDDVPVASLEKDDGRRLAGATPDDIQQALAFGRTVAAHQPDGHLAVHCAFGRSRSPAIALAILADQWGPGRELQAVDSLMRFDRPMPMSGGGMTGLLGPNPGIVRQVDDMLGCGLRLEAALLLRSPGFNSWRSYWVRQGVWSAAAEAERDSRLDEVVRQMRIAME